MSLLALGGHNQLKKGESSWNLPLFPILFVSATLDCKAFTAATGTGSIRIVELKSLTIEAVCEFELRAVQVKVALHVYDYLHPVSGIKFLIALLWLVIEIQVVR